MAANRDLALRNLAFSGPRRRFGVPTMLPGPPSRLPGDQEAYHERFATLCLLLRLLHGPRLA